MMMFAVIKIYCRFAKVYRECFYDERQSDSGNKARPDSFFASN